MRIISQLTPAVKITARLSCSNNIRRYSSLIQVRNKQRVYENLKCQSLSVRLFYDGDKCNASDKQFARNKELELTDLRSTIWPVALIDLNPLSCESAKVLLIPLNWHGADEHAMRTTVNSIFSKPKNLKQIEAFSQALKEVPTYSRLEQREAKHTDPNKEKALLTIAKVKNVSKNCELVQKNFNSIDAINNDVKYLDDLATAMDKTLQQCCLHSMQISADNKILSETMKLCSLPFARTQVKPDENLKLTSLLKIDTSDINLGDITWNRKMPFSEMQSTSLTNITFPTSLIKKSFSTKTTPLEQQKLLCASSKNLNKDTESAAIKPNVRSASSSSVSSSNYTCKYNFSFLSNLFGTETFLMSCDMYNNAIKEAAKRKEALALCTKGIKNATFSKYKRPKVVNIKGCTSPQQNLSTICETTKQVSSATLPPLKQIAKDNCKDNPCKPEECPDRCKIEMEKLQRSKEEETLRKRKKVPTGCVSPKCKKDDNCTNLKNSPCKKASNQFEIKSSQIASPLIKTQGNCKKDDPCKPEICPDRCKEEMEKLERLKKEKQQKNKNKFPTGCISPKCKKEDNCTKLKKQPCKKLDSSNKSGSLECSQKKKNDYCEKGKGKGKGSMPASKPGNPCADDHTEYKPKCNSDPCKQGGSPCGGPQKKAAAGGCGKKEPDRFRKNSALCKQNDCGKKKERRDPCKRKEEVCNKNIRDPCGSKKDNPCGGQKKKDPCLPQKKNDSCGDQKKKDPCGGQKKKDPCLPQKKNDSCGGQKKKDPCGGKKDYPCGDQKKKDPCLPQKKNDLFGGQKKKDPCGGQKKKDPCLPQKKNDSCGGQKKKSPCGSKNKPSSPCKSKGSASRCGTKSKPKSSCGKQQAQTKPNCKKSFSTSALTRRYNTNSRLNRTYSTFLTLPRLQNNISCFGFMRHFSSKNGGNKGKKIDHGKISQCQAVATKVPPKRKPNFNPHPKDGLRKCYPIYDMECRKLCKDDCKNKSKSPKGTDNKKRNENRLLTPQKFKNKFLHVDYKTPYFGFQYKHFHLSLSNRSNFFFTNLLQFCKSCNKKEMKCVKRPVILDNEEIMNDTEVNRSLEKNGIFNESIQVEHAGVFEKLVTEIPNLSDYDILIHPTKIAISDSDIYCFENGINSGITLGHDAAGIVVDIGRNVKKFKPGDRVVIEAGVSCGICDFCKKGAYNMCIKLRYNGFFVKYQSHPADLCFKLPHALSLTEGALTPTLALGCQAVFSTRITPASNVLIMGSGSTAVACALCAHAIGAKQVVLTCTSHASLESIRTTFGFDYVHYNENSDSTEQLESIFYQFEDWPDVVINCAINNHTMSLAVVALKPCGSCILTECDTESVKFNAFDAIMKNIRLITSFRSNNMYPIAINLMSSGRAPIFKIIHSIFTWNNIDEAFRVAQNASNCGYQKIIIQSGNEEILPNR